ncbi:hypothetical protein DFJ58DRAFT_413680 [Suillus subalutaceus]|uniref:uncharacterized protein n=1 Tax=Suillus subalutaceus TaxID=48586 RepID=UPI001B882668|nr:uncharacterized protein DFJ58DRAFT_413680 [Suillus subalutaceus]KAG1852250.1 hypothetical protein DFJ58DRAFT_413680 [Suillus subalutaceus]
MINLGTVRGAWIFVCFVVTFSLISLCIWCSEVIGWTKLLVLTFCYLGYGVPSRYRVAIRQSMLEAS